MTDVSPSGELDLTPRAGRPGSVRSNRWRNWLIVGAFVVVAGGILYQALTSARVYFYNVDEAVANQADLGERTFRMQGRVIDEPVTQSDGSMTFTISFGGVDSTVRHVGAEPTDLFRVGEQVVAVGHWQSADEFQSSQLLVKHSEQYVEDNPDRISPAQ